MASRRGPLATVLAASLLLAACGSSEQATSHAGHGGMHGGTHGDVQASKPSGAGGATGSAAKANAVDLAFAEGMLPHHAQAITMADDALARSTNAQLRQLAATIKATQQPEVDQLTRWLSVVGRPPTSLTMDHADQAMDHAHGAHAMEGMEGMVAEGDLAQLRQLSGQAFDRRWLELMVAHHLGAIAMAKQELAAGSATEPMAIAKAVVASQQREVDQMRSWLAAMPS